MKLKTIVAATSLALLSLGVQAATLDSLSGNATWTLSGQTTETNLTAGTNETTWGVGYIDSIVTNTQTWNGGTSDGTYLYYMIYGIADQNIVTTNGITYDIYNVGATGGGGADGLIHLDVYRSATQILSLTNSYSANPNDRSGFSSFTPFAGMELYLSVALGAGKQLTDIAPLANTCDATFSNFPCETTPGTNESLATLVQHTFAAQLPTSGHGDFFAYVTGGTAIAKWDTNGMDYGYDFNAGFDLKRNGSSFGSGSCSAEALRLGNCFEGKTDDPVLSNAIPEPGSMALAGLGLLGLAALRRRKQA